jgi:hypothetical protein
MVELNDRNETRSASWEATHANKVLVRLQKLWRSPAWANAAIQSRRTMSTAETSKIFKVLEFGNHAHGRALSYDAIIRCRRTNSIARVETLKEVT